MIKDQNAEVSDTTGVDSSTEVGNKKIRQHILSNTLAQFNNYKDLYFTTWNFPLSIIRPLLSCKW
jgi:hypothetical protein